MKRTEEQLESLYGLIGKDSWNELTKKERAEIAVPVRTSKKIGRNDICTCGSAAKFKNCCLKHD